MKRHLVTPITGIFLLTLTFGCGDNKKEAATQESEAQTEKIESVYSALDDVNSPTDASKVAEILTAEDDPEVSKFTSFLSKLQSACKPTSSGDLADSDGDRIKANANLLFNCDKALGPVSISVKGNVSIKDQNDTVKFPASGLSIEGKQISVNIKLPNGKAVSKTSDTSLNLVVNGAEKTVTMKRSSQLDAKDKSHFITSEVESKSVADDQANPKKSGSLQFKAKVSITAEGQEAKQFTAEGTGLKYSQECKPRRIKEGKISINADGKTKEIVIEACKVKK